MEHYRAMLAELGDVRTGAVARAMWERLPRAERPVAFRGQRGVRPLAAAHL